MENEYNLKVLELIGLTLLGCLGGVILSYLCNKRGVAV
jgi:hypothetical protein